MKYYNTDVSYIEQFVYHKKVKKLVKNFVLQYY